MSTPAFLAKLEPRERKLLLGLLGLVGAILLLGLPVLVYSGVTSRRDANDELRTLLQEIRGAQTLVADRKAKKDAVTARYARVAPPLAGFIEEAARENELVVPESTDKPEVPHGKRFSERITVVKMHKIGLKPLVKTLEKIERSGYPVAITRLNLKPRSGEPDSYEVELGVSAYDRKPDAKADKKDTGAESTPTGDESVEKLP